MCSSSARRCPTSRARWTQSSIVTPRIGTNGITSVAPTRGCSPRWVVRSKRLSAGSTSPPIAGMLATMGGEVDPAESLFGRAKRGFGDGLGWPDERQDRAIVVSVALAVQHDDAGDGLNGVDQRVNSLGLPAFADVGDTLDKTIHVPPTVASARKVCQGVQS